MSLKAKLDVFPVENYSQTSVDVSNGQTGVSGDKRNGNGNISNSASYRPKNAIEKLLSLKKRCEEEPCVHSVEGVLLVHLHRHPHILLMKQINLRARDADGIRTVPPSNTNTEVVYRLPGGRCRRGEAEESCLLRKLGRHLLNEEKTLPGVAEVSNAGNSDTVVDMGMKLNASKAGSCFRVGEVLATWYRPHFTPHMYPYVPAHIAASSVREVRTVYLVHLEPTVYFNMVQEGVELVAAPLFDLYENSGKYGPIIASLPVLLSRVLINYCSTEY